MGAVAVSAGRIERDAGWALGEAAVCLTGPDSEERPGCGRLRGNHTMAISQAGALFVMQDTGWDHALKVTGGGEGLVGHAEAVLLRKLADQAGLTAALGPALARAGSSRWWTGVSRWFPWRWRSRSGRPA